MSFPLAQTVRHLPYVGEVRNTRGNLVDAWGEATEVAVYGWYISTTHEPQIAGHERVRVDAQVLAPPTFRPSAKDKVELPGPGEDEWLPYEVEGDTEDYNHGPFGWRPGNLVNLRRVTG